MNLATNRIKEYRSESAILPQRLNQSQEYRVLATLRYLYPAEYGNMILRDAPDLQDNQSHIGIEVVACASNQDMKASRVFSDLCEGKKKDGYDPENDIKKLVQC